MTSTQLTFTQSSTYLKSALFICANIALPHLFHLIPGGGIMFLPVYFFTLIGAMRYGMQVGMLTAVFTPIIGNLLFGAPASALIPDMLFKGIMLAIVASLAVSRWSASLLTSLLSVVAAWLLVGLVEWPFTGAAFAFQDFVTGLPGLAMMIIGSWLINKYL